MSEEPEFHDLRGMQLTKHAARRWMQRNNLTCPKIARNNFNQIAYRMTEVWVKPKFRVKQLLNHGVREARYFRHNKWLFVVANDCIVTIHTNTADRFTSTRPT